VHHAANAEYLDANYGGVLIIFDRLFGTLRVERHELPCRYGLVEPLRSNNPVRIAFHEWLALARDLWAVRNWRDGWRALFGPPSPALSHQPAGGYRRVTTAVDDSRISRRHAIEPAR
jgi:hypothetical protein